MTPPRILLTTYEIVRAHEAWRFNCGPASLAAIAGLTTEEVRPHFGTFPGFTNPSLMCSAIRAAGFRHSLADTEWPAFGVARIQFLGPWMATGVPPAAAYKYTHWVACAGGLIYDINCVGPQVWLDEGVWSRQIVPEILSSPTYKRATGEWKVTHAIEMRAFGGGR